MGRWFPEWEYYEADRDHELALIWEGELQPLPQQPDSAMKILADLAAERLILVDRGGLLKHDGACKAGHELPPALQGRTDYGISFRLQVHHRAPPAHPKVYAIRPLLGAELFQTQGHVNGDGSLCPLFVPDGEWDGHRDTLAKYLRRGVSVLLAKHLFWLWTGSAGKGQWPGRRGPHGREEAARQSLRLPPTAQCWCGSGKSHEACHREEDKELLRIRRVGSHL